MLGNRSASFAGRVLFLIGLVVLPELWPKLKEDFRRGRRSARVARLDIATLLDENVDALRARLGLES